MVMKGHIYGKVFVGVDNFLLNEYAGLLETKKR